MEIRILVLRSCADCPHYEELGSGMVSCSNAQRELDSCCIPEWCPLPDRKSYLLSEELKDRRRDRKLQHAVNMKRKALRTSATDAAKEGK